MKRAAVLGVVAEGAADPRQGARQRAQRAWPQALDDLAVVLQAPEGLEDHRPAASRRAPRRGSRAVHVRRPGNRSSIGRIGRSASGVTRSKMFAAGSG